MAAVDPEWAKRYSFELETLGMLAHPLDSLWESLTANSSEAISNLESANQRVVQTSAALAKMKADRQAAVDAANSNSMEAVFGRELAAIDAESAALTRQINVLNAKKAAVEAGAKLQDALDIQNGVDPNKVAANAARRGQASQNSEIDQKVTEAQNAFYAAQEREQKAIEKIGYAVSIGSKNTEQLSNQAQAAGLATEEALANLRSVQEIADQQKLAVAAATQNTILDLGVTATKEFGDKVKDFVDKFQPITKQQESYKQGLEAALADGYQINQDSAFIQASFQALIASLKSSQSAVVAPINELSMLNTSLVAQSNTNTAEIRKLRSQHVSSGVIR